MITVHAREAIYVKQKGLPLEVKESLLKKYSYRFYEEKVCNDCEFLPDRHCDTCDNCAAFLGGADLATQVKMGSTQYLKGPVGDQTGFVRVLAKAGLDYTVKEHHPDTRMKRRIRFTGTLLKFQPPAVEAIVAKKRGVLKSPPRTGKTVMAAAAICQINGKTMIVASQREWLNGFKETFVGSATQKALTNCGPTQIGFAKTYEDFLKYDICLVTVQTFWSEKGQKLLRRVRDMFRCLFVDEVHTGASPKYAIAIANLNTEYKIGLSGTPNRKDQRYILMRNLMGPIIYQVTVEGLAPQMRLVQTQLSAVIKGNVPWARLINMVEKDPKRIKLIADWAVKDVSNGHMVLIPLGRRIVQDALIAAINKIAGKVIAYPFHGQVSQKNRDKYLQMARNYEAKVLVGTTKLLSTGTNIPRASALYDVSLGSNMENCEQRSRRVLTPYEGKPRPILRYFLDNISVRRNCIRNEYFGVVKPIIKATLTPNDEQILKAYFATNERRPNQMRRVEL